MIQNNRLNPGQPTVPAVSSTPKAPAAASVSTTSGSPAPAGPSQAEDSCKLETKSAKAAPKPFEFLEPGEPIAYYGSGYRTEDIAAHLRDANKGLTDFSQPLAGGEYLHKLVPYELEQLKQFLHAELANPSNCDDPLLKAILAETDKTLDKRLEEKKARPNRLEPIDPARFEEFLMKSTKAPGAKA